MIYFTHAMRKLVMQKPLDSFRRGHSSSYKTLMRRDAKNFYSPSNNSNRVNNTLKISAILFNIYIYRRYFINFKNDKKNKD